MCLFIWIFPHRKECNCLYKARRTEFNRKQRLLALRGLGVEFRVKISLLIQLFINDFLKSRCSSSIPKGEAVFATNTSNDHVLQICAICGRCFPSLSDFFLVCLLLLLLSLFNSFLNTDSHIQCFMPSREVLYHGTITSTFSKML